MSVSNPFIKELKSYVRKLIESEALVTDETEELLSFCICLEKCLQSGVSAKLNTFGILNLPDAWQWFEDIAHKRQESLISYSSIVEDVIANQKVQNTTGKMRLLIRTCLNRKCLDIPIGYLVRTPFLASEYYSTNSILGDEILGEIFYSVCLQISKLNFRLNLKNASFLDDTWELPICLNVEYVPCKTIGISVCFEKGKALVIRVEKNSVASEDGTVEVGDILDEINGKIISSQTRGNLGKILKRTACLPISAHIIKYRNKEKGSIYEPITNLIKNCGVDHMKELLNNPLTNYTFMEANESKSQEKSNIKPSSQSTLGYTIDYCGCISIGTDGSVKQIENAISKLLQKGNINFIPIRFECLELGVKISQISDDKVILEQNYMAISSCGSSLNFPDHFAYISSQENCCIATKFTAHVFFHKNEHEIQSILESLSQGFYRTHFAV